MSRQIINQYYNNLERAIQFGKSRNETAIRNHFWILLNDYARKLHYEVVTEVKTMGTKGRAVQPDGIVKNLFGLDKFSVEAYLYSFIWCRITTAKIPCQNTKSK